MYPLLIHDMLTQGLFGKAHLQHQSQFGKGVQKFVDDKKDFFLLVVIVKMN